MSLVPVVNFGYFRHTGRAGHPLLEVWYRLLILGTLGILAELGTRYLPLFGKKSCGAAAYRYSNKKVAPLPLLACKTAAAAACCYRYFKNINSTKNDGIHIRYLMVKFQLCLQKLVIQAF